MSEESKELAPRDALGRLQKGSKLGTGRKKGSKNKATILREKMENKVSIKLSKLGPKVVQKVGEQALTEGCRQSQKMIMDRIAPTQKATDGNDGKHTSVTVTISNLTRENVDDVMKGTLVDGEYEHVEE